MSSPISQSFYTDRTMSQPMTEVVAGFLGLKNTVANYSCIDRRHHDNFKRYGFPFKCIAIPYQLVNQFFANIHNFLKANTLELNNCGFKHVVIPNGTGNIDQLIFNILPREYGSLSADELLVFLKAFPNLKVFSAIHLVLTSSWIIRPKNILSDPIRQSLNGLKELYLRGGNGLWDLPLEFLQCSRKFEMINFCDMRLSNELLAEVVCNPNLTHLCLTETQHHQYGGAQKKIDYSILARVHSLRSFTPPPDISKEELISIIRANPELTHLDLQGSNRQPIRGHKIVTDEVLESIGAYLPRLLDFKLNWDSTDKVTAHGFNVLFRNCLNLRQFSLCQGGAVSEYVTLPPNALVGMQNCPQLQVLELEHVVLTNELITLLASLTQLKSLVLKSCKAFYPDKIRELKSLVHLKHLELNFLGKILTDETVCGFIDDCPALEELSLELGGVIKLLPIPRPGEFSILTDACLHAIRTALRENRSALRLVSCALNRRKSDFKAVASELMAEFPRLKII